MERSGVWFQSDVGLLGFEKHGEDMGNQTQSRYSEEDQKKNQRKTIGKSLKVLPCSAFLKNLTKRKGALSVPGDLEAVDFGGLLCCAM